MTIPIHLQFRLQRNIIQPQNIRRDLLKGSQSPIHLVAIELVVKASYVITGIKVVDGRSGDGELDFRIVHDVHPPAGNNDVAVVEFSELIDIGHPCEGVTESLGTEGDHHTLAGKIEGVGEFYFPVQ